MTTSNAFTPEHEEILTELINVGFGGAISPVAELIGRFIQISVPEVEQLDVSRLMERLRGFTPPDTSIHAISQAFCSEFNGDALLLLNASPEALSELLGVDPNDELEQQDALLEIGNILISACVGQLVDLLEVKTVFLPPRLALFRQPIPCLKLKIASGITHLLVKTRFRLETSDFDGFLLLMLNENVVKVLVQKIDEMLEEL